MIIDVIWTKEANLQCPEAENSQYSSGQFSVMLA